MVLLNAFNVFEARSLFNSIVKEQGDGSIMLFYVKICADAIKAWFQNRTVKRLNAEILKLS